MKKVLVASKNPVKINSVANGLKLVFPTEEFEIEGVDVESGVPDQPMGNEQTLLGATNRVSNLMKRFEDADFYVGIEGGLEDTKHGMEAFAWVAISSNGKFGRSRTASFFLPESMANLINEGKELSEVADIVFGRQNSGQENGTIGNLTGDLITRTDYYTDAVILALIPFRNPDMY